MLVKHLPHRLTLLVSYKSLGRAAQAHLVSKLQECYCKGHENQSTKQTVCGMNTSTVVRVWLLIIVRRRPNGGQSMVKTFKSIPLSSLHDSANDGTRDADSIA